MENVNLKIRRANPGDAQAIHNILEVAFADYYNVLGIEIKTTTETLDEIKEDILNKQVYVAVVNNIILCSTIRYETIGDVCYISRFGVLPKWQSTGTGGLLLEKAQEFCSQNNIRAMALHTASKMFKQIRYYYGQGFFIHSTSSSRGYIRALLVYEFGADYHLDKIIKHKS